MKKITFIAILLLGMIECFDIKHRSCVAENNFIHLNRGTGPGDEWGLLYNFLFSFCEATDTQQKNSNGSGFPDKVS